MITLERTIVDILNKCGRVPNSGERKRLRDLDRKIKKGDMNVSDALDHVKRHEEYGWKYLKKEDYREIEKILK